MSALLKTLLEAYPKLDQEIAAYLGTLSKKTCLQGRAIFIGCQNFQNLMVKTVRGSWL